MDEKPFVQFGNVVLNLDYEFLPRVLIVLYVFGDVLPGHGRNHGNIFAYQQSQKLLRNHRTPTESVHTLDDDRPAAVGQHILDHAQKFWPIFLCTAIS